MANFFNLHANHCQVTSLSGTFLTPKTPNPVHKTTRVKPNRSRLIISGLSDRASGSALVEQSPQSNGEEAVDMIDEKKKEGRVMMEEYYVKEHGWKVRRLVEDRNEMSNVALIQAHAFHVPSFFLDDFFFFFFQAEVLSGLLYRLRNSPPDRYACLVAEPAKDDDEITSKAPQSDDQQKLVGVVDVTVLRDKDVVQHLEGAKEYLYVSGIAVANNYRRKKVATVLLKACEVIAVIWGYSYLVLRAYENDNGARALYSNAGYRLVSRDPLWVTLIGRKRRILMVKRLLGNGYDSHCSSSCT